MSRFFVRFVMAFPRISKISTPIYSRVSIGCGITTAGTTKTSSASTSGWVAWSFALLSLLCWCRLGSPSMRSVAEEVLLASCWETHTTKKRRGTGGPGDMLTNVPLQHQHAAKPDFFNRLVSTSRPPQLPDFAVEFFNPGKVVLRVVQERSHRGARQHPGLFIVAHNCLPLNSVCFSPTVLIGSLVILMHGSHVLFSE